MGCPVVIRRNLNGKLVHPKNGELTPQNMKQLGCGYITEVFYNATDGWWYGRGVVDTDEAAQEINRVGFCSVGYHVNSVNPAGVWHDIKYHDEITDFSGEHLAIVGNPRYEEATIKLNSKTTMKLFQWIRKFASGATPTDAQNAKPEDPIFGETTFEIPVAEGKTESVTLERLTEVYLLNAKHEVTPESEITCNGKTYKVNAMIQAFDIWEKQNAEADKAAKDKADKDAADKDAKDKADKEKQNAKQPDHFSNLLNAAAHASQPSLVASSFDTIEERLNRGKEQYGSARK